MYLIYYTLSAGSTISRTKLLPRALQSAQRCSLSLLSDQCCLDIVHMIVNG